MVCRTEHPRPQFERKDWMNLNGEWQFAFDYGNSGVARKMYEDAAEFTHVIQVPFCMESGLSGIGHKDFVESVWYRRSVELTKEQLEGRIVLHFGAVDYFTTVYVNGVKCGTHKGGYVSFSFDITEYVSEGKNIITVHVQDNARDYLIPSGKQSMEYASKGCFYTRTTGIWQTVWVEFTPKTYIKSVKYYTDVQNQTLCIHAELEGRGRFAAQAFFEGKTMGEALGYSEGNQLITTISLKEKHLWEIGKGRLYDLVLQYEEDVVKSYFGLRSIEYADYKFLLNGKSVFQRLILDQGFYPDGIYTAPTEEALIRDIDLSMDMGFNGARLHEKIFEERYLYHCDRKGYLVWGEFPDWGLDMSNPEVIYSILPEWSEEIKRDFNHPSIVGWCPLNEVWTKNGKEPSKEVIATVYKMTKSLDDTRPCIDASGGYHVETDIYDLHDYQQNPEVFQDYFGDFSKNFTIKSPGIYSDKQVAYDKKTPFFVSEYGGIRWTKEASGWGYGNAPSTKEEFMERLKGLTDVLLDNEKMFGFCYTQLTDVEQEQNGLYTYYREPKFETEEIRRIISRKAAIEQE